MVCYGELMVTMFALMLSQGTCKYSSFYNNALNNFDHKIRYVDGNFCEALKGKPKVFIMQVSNSAHKTSSLLYINQKLISISKISHLGMSGWQEGHSAKF